MCAYEYKCEAKVDRIGSAPKKNKTRERDAEKEKEVYLNTQIKWNQNSIEKGVI